MKALPDGRDKNAEERKYLDECHRTIRGRPDVEAILDSESFFDSTQRSEHDAWDEIYKSVWIVHHTEIKGSEITSALRDHLASLQNENCCYCWQPLLKGGYSRQIEHVLPRAVYGRFSFHFWNVAVACERCNRIKRKKGYQPVSATLKDYPDHSYFTDYFHPRFHAHKKHIAFTEVACADYRYIVYVGQTMQGRKLVEDVLTDAALEMTRESTDAEIHAAIERIRAGARKHGTAAVDAIRQFEAALREAIDQGAC
ncbi:HNH endonuclease [Paraburkholderia xenovorans]